MPPSFESGGPANVLRGGAVARKGTGFAIDPTITKRIDLPYCCDDEAAKVCASRMAEWLAVELWDGDRMVATFEPSYQ
jgi:hypothetical protein